MSIDEGKLNPGIVYQFEIIAYTAACLSQNLSACEEVDDFEIYTNQDVPIFDDIIIKVKYKSQQTPFVYMGQIKRYKKPKINFNEGKDKLDKYLKKIVEIKDKSNRKPFLQSLLKDVPDENIEFFYFSNSFLSPPKDGSENPLKHPIVLEDKTYCYLECNTTYKSIFPLQNSSACYKLITKAAHRYSNIFDKFYFFLSQPDHKQIASRIVDLSPNIISISAANDIINYTDAYLKESEKAKLTKHVFDTHLLRLCLSSFIVSPTTAVKINPRLAHIWNQLVMQFDITITSTEMESYIFGCLWQEVIKLYKSEFNWNESIINIKNINNEVDISDNFLHLSEVKEIRHWLYIPDTITELLIEMWKSDYLPLVLSPNTNVSILKKFKHLNKRFVILDVKDNIYNEVANLNVKIFTNASNIFGSQLGKEFLKKICISLQGREPVDVYSIVNEDIDLMKELKCVHLLHIMKEREIYLKTQVLSDSNIVKQIDIDDMTFREHENECMSCEASSSNATMKNNPGMSYNTLCNMQAARDVEQPPIEIEKSNIKQFCVDEDGNNFYLKNDTAVPIIGKCIKRSEKYINRYLRNATLEATIFNLKRRKVICFLTGDLNDVGWMAQNRNQVIQGSVEYLASKIEEELEKDKNAIVAIKDDEIEELWSKVCAKECPILYAKVENKKMSILKYQNCENLSSHISYSGSILNEKSFFGETSGGITIISGEPGSGKSTLLRSLFNICRKDNYVLFCDLNDYRQSLVEENAELFGNTLSFILRQEEKQSPFSSPYSTCPSYIDFLQKFLGISKEIIVFLDSFDEVLPVCQESILNLIKVLNKPNVRLIIASRLVMVDVLINSFQVEPIKIETLNAEDIKAYIKNEKLKESEFRKYPQDLRENPMYLNFLVTLHQDNSSLLATITRCTLYNAIIKEHIERYYKKKAEAYNSAQYKNLRKDILNVHKLLAMIEIFGDKMLNVPGIVYNDLMEECIDTGKVKLGLIIRFNDDGPVFLHRTFAEYLIAEWLSENIGQEYAKAIYEQMFDDNMLHTRFFLDEILCVNRRLHNAVLRGDLPLVESLCSEDDNHLKEVDKLNRNALHLVSTYFSKKQIRNLAKILEAIVRCMKTKGLDFSNNYDLIRKSTWLQYLGTETEFLDFACWNDLTVTSEIYFVCTERIGEGIILSIDYGMLDTAVELLSRQVRLLSKYYDKLLLAAIIETRFKEVRQLIELKNYGNMKFKTLWKACTNLSPANTVLECKQLRIYGGFTALHVACIYENTGVVKELLKFGVEVDAIDDFKCEPLNYSVIQGSFEIVTCLVEHISHINELKAKNAFASILYRTLTLSKSKTNRKGPMKFRKNLIHQPYLHISLQKNFIEIAKVLLENGFDVNERNYKGETAVYFAVNVYEDAEAIVQEDATKIKLLLNCNPNCNVQDDFGNTPLHTTIEKVFLNIRNLLGGLYYSSDNDDDTSLYTTTKNGDEILECLINGSDINLQNQDGATPLMVAVEHFGTILDYSVLNNIDHFSDMLKMLLQAGANVNDKDKDGNTALNNAVMNFSEEYIQMLLDYGADVGLENKTGDTPLITSVRAFSDVSLRILLNAGADPNHRNRNGDTALHLAAKSYKSEIAKILLNNGADVDIENEYGDTALLTAVQADDSRMLRFLINPAGGINDNDFDVGMLLLTAGADVNHQNRLGNTALHLAAKKGRISIAKMLLYNNVDVNIVNKEGHTAIFIAKNYKHDAVFDILSKYMTCS